MSYVRAALNWQTLLAAFFILLPTVLGFYHGDRGKLVAASEKLIEPTFSKTVLFMFDQSWYHARALVLNRPYPDFETLPRYLRNADIPVYWGGPVEDRDTVYVLERREGDVPRVTLLDELTERDADFLEKVKARPDVYRIYVGYAGWGLAQFQLEKEREFWRVKTFDPFVFDASLPEEGVWERVLFDAEGKTTSQLRKKLKL